ncbi:MAG: RHS repeat-associated core domain-containing protein [Flavobacteriales bacterium]
MKYTTQQEIRKRFDSLQLPYYGKDNDDYARGTGFCCSETETQLRGGVQGGRKQGDGVQGKSVNNRIPTENENAELYQYYYHPDHLGSSSYITNLDGEVVQHVEYVPFGEVFIEERNNVWNTPYLFNAKELDEETGLYYYGARYYEPRISLWLSVDPLAEKYPNVSPYAYVVNNPIIYTDPDGNQVELCCEELEQFLKSFIKTVAENAVYPIEKFDSFVYNVGLGRFEEAFNDLSDLTPRPASIEVSSVEPIDISTPEKAGKFAGTIVPIVINKGKEKATKNRVKLRKDVKQEVIDNAPKTRDGKYIDPNTRQPIERFYDIGHKKGQEWRKRKKMHEEKGSTRKEVIEAENNPDLYQVEDRSNNRSHKYEEK